MQKKKSEFSDFFFMVGAALSPRREWEKVVQNWQTEPEAVYRYCER